MIDPKCILVQCRSPLGQLSTLNVALQELCKKQIPSKQDVNCLANLTSYIKPIYQNQKGSILVCSVIKTLQPKITTIVVWHTRSRKGLVVET